MYVDAKKIRKRVSAFSKRRESRRVSVFTGTMELDKGKLQKMLKN